MTGNNVDDEERAAAAVIEQADALLITCGAGMGVDSGLPTFRGPEAAGFCRIWPTYGQHGAGYEELMSPAMFDVDPHLAWGFHGVCLEMYRAARPHSGYAVLRKLAEARRGAWFVYTSNIDGQFQRAGFNAAGVMECHGSALRLQCTRPCGDQTWPAPEAVRVDAATGLALEMTRCLSARHAGRSPARTFECSLTRSGLGAQPPPNPPAMRRGRSVLPGACGRSLPVECRAGRRLRRTGEQRLGHPPPARHADPD